MFNRINCSGDLFGGVASGKMVFTIGLFTRSFHTQKEFDIRLSFGHRLKCGLLGPVLSNISLVKLCPVPSIPILTT